MKHGIVYFFTTNHPERLDPALIRHGRIDLTVELSYMTAHQTAMMFDRFFPQPPVDQMSRTDVKARKNDLARIQELLKNNVTPALLENVFFRHYESYNINNIVSELKKEIAADKDILKRAAIESKKADKDAKRTKMNNHECDDDGCDR